MKTESEVIREIEKLSSPQIRDKQAHFGISGVKNYGLSQPQIKSIAKQCGKNHGLALQLWKTGIHEARHIASLIADKKQITEELMEEWVSGFNSWDIVDGTCSALFCRTPFAWAKAMEWACRKPEFEKRAGFSLMAYLAVHDKKAPDGNYEKFFPLILECSSDERNFVKKAVNWALRQIGKRNPRLCLKAIACAKEIQKKNDPASRWIASGALRELEKYLREGKIKSVGAA
jgi:3-methyladenine DNA glycosylase AlkD